MSNKVKKCDYEELISIFYNHNISIIEDKTKHEKLIYDKYKNFIIIVKYKISISFNISCLPHISSYITYILMKNFSKPNLIKLKSSHFYDSEISNLIFGEIAEQKYRNDIENDIKGGILIEQKFDYILNNFQPRSIN